MPGPVGPIGGSPAGRARPEGAIRRVILSEIAGVSDRKQRDDALKFALEVDSGNLNINGGTQFRADLMPYGGLKDSGTGKEGPRYAVEEMTELKMVIVHRS